MSGPNSHSAKDLAHCAIIMGITSPPPSVYKGREIITNLGKPEVGYKEPSVNSGARQQRASKDFESYGKGLKSDG